MSTFHFENDEYVLDVSETDAGDVRLSFTFKKQAPRPEPDPAQRARRGQRVIIPANEHHRRAGTYEDDMVILDHGQGHYEVTSRSEPGAFHWVHIDEQGRETCDCLAHAYQRLCRHLRGVRLLTGRDPETPLPLRREVPLSGSNNNGNGSLNPEEMH